MEIVPKRAVSGRLVLIDNGWLFLEAPGICYEPFMFCPKHGDMLKQKQNLRAIVAGVDAMSAAIGDW